MAVPFSRFFGYAMVVVATLALAGCGGIMPKSSSLRAQQSLKQSTVSKLESMGMSAGGPMFMRLFKQSSELEVWKQTSSGDYRLFKIYAVCKWSGVLGPKIKEGDRQAPEGFYTVTPGALNPNSIAYLSFNTGYPNKFDRAWGRTGTDLMVHGDCSSRGCYALSNEDIAEVYALARETFNAGNASFQLQIFPFRMTPGNLAQYSANANIDFWMNIKEGYDRFELAKTPPVWDVCEKKYVFDLKREDGTPLDAVAACPARNGDALLTALQAKQAADDAQYRIEVAALTDREAKLAAEAKAEADAKAAAKARGEAMGNFVGGLLGGQPAPAPPTPAPTGGTAAPMPLPPPKGT